MDNCKRYPPAILATCPIPWKEDHELDEPLFRRVVAQLAQNFTRHVYLFGTAGEGYAVSDRQFESIVGSFRSALSMDARPMIGIISLSLGTIVDRIALGRELGFREFQLSLPSWGALTDSETDRFFAETCGRFPDCRFLHYNLKRAKRVLDGDAYARLSKAHPNLVAVKMGGEDPAAFADILTKAPALQCFFTEFGFAAMRDAHECGLLAALSACCHKKGLAFHAARGAELSMRAEEFRMVHRALKGAIDPMATHMDGVYDKLLIKLEFPEFPLRLLAPYAFAGEDAFLRFVQNLPAGWPTPRKT
ncbi:MAG: dihydrodipicolinate synthase family protein [Opitutaceae bacterium]|nr:dihydrodipicolinate synthase family protein [Opitutaceae bacterium]